MRELINAEMEVKSETAAICEEAAGGSRLSPSATTYFSKERPAIEMMGWRDMVIAVKARVRPACSRILSTVVLYE